MANRSTPGSPRRILLWGGVLLALLGLGLAGAWLAFAPPPPGPPLLQSPAVTPLLARWQARWQARLEEDEGAAESTAAAWREEAEQAWAAGLGRKAARALERELVLSPSDEALLWMVAVSARWPALADLSAGERAALLAAAGAAAEPSPALAGAMAWDLLARGQAPAALQWVAAPDDADLLALSARLRAQRETGQDPADAALALHAASPADVEACEEAARAGLARGDLSLAERVLSTCEEAGVRSPLALRLLGDVLDAAGEPAEACGAYLRAGADLHAAVILMQGGDCDPPAPADLVARALADPAPEARLHAAWRAALLGDAAAARAAATALSSAGELRTPPQRAAAAAAWLVAGDAALALQALGEGAGAEAGLLRARALAMLGRREEAKAALDQSLATAPWALDLHRQRAALLAGLDPAALEAAVDALAAQDPVPLSLARLEPDRLLPWRALAPAPWPLPALSPRARAIVRALDPEAALAGTGEGEVTDPDGAVARARLAEAVLGADGADPTTLAARLDRALLARPDDPVVAALGAVAAGELDRADQAAALLAQARAQGPDLVATGWAGANLALDAGQPVEARSLAAALVAAHATLPGLRALRFAVEVQSETPSAAPGAP